jgi:hypothetical protein
MSALEQSAHPQRSLKLLALVFGIALGSEGVAAAMDSGSSFSNAAGGGAGLQEYRIGSGYTSNQDGAIQAGRLNDGLALEDDLTARQFDRGYYKDPVEITLVVPAHDGTAYQFNRGYYQDPDAVIVVANSVSGGEQNET